jgi:hypothetical protein
MQVDSERVEYMRKEMLQLLVAKYSTRTPLISFWFLFKKEILYFNFHFYFILFLYILAYAKKILFYLI